MVSAKTPMPCEKAWTKMTTSGARIRNAPSSEHEGDQRAADGRAVADARRLACGLRAHVSVLAV